MNFTSEVVTSSDINKSIAKQFRVLHSEYYEEGVDPSDRILALQEYVKYRQTPRGHAEFIVSIQNGSFHEKYEKVFDKIQN